MRTGEHVPGVSEKQGWIGAHQKEHGTRLRFMDDITSFGAERSKPVPQVRHVKQHAFASSGVFERDGGRRE